jgi:hypothetical protein
MPKDPPLDPLRGGISRASSGTTPIRPSAGLPQIGAVNPEGGYLLFRIGDAVAARNTHATICDALRLVKDL